jgi:hypothetical protein
MTTEDLLFSAEKLMLRRTLERDQVTIYWVGECDFRNPSEVLNPTFTNFLKGLDGRRLVLNFCELAFMNSSSVSPILSFLKGAVAKGIPVQLIYNGKLSWQRTTATSMRTLANSLKTLTVSLQSSE